MTLQQKLDQLKERMAKAEVCPDEQDDPVSKYGMEQFQEGFTAAVELFLPCVEALNDCGCYCSANKKLICAPCSALSTLERRIEEGGKR